MLAAVLATVAALQQVLFCEYDIAFGGIIKIIRFKLRSPEIIIHLVHVCKVNKNRGEGLQVVFYSFLCLHGCH